MVMTDPKRIWLQPRQCVDPDQGRMWCEDDAWQYPGVEYVRADRQQRRWMTDHERLVLRVGILAGWIIGGLVIIATVLVSTEPLCFG